MLLAMTPLFSHVPQKAILAARYHQLSCIQRTNSAQTMVKLRLRVEANRRQLLRVRLITLESKCVCHLLYLWKEKQMRYHRAPLASQTGLRRKPSPLTICLELSPTLEALQMATIFPASSRHQIESGFYSPELNAKMTNWDLLLSFKAKCIAPLPYRHR